MKTVAANFLALAMLLAPSAALACANCYAASSQLTIFAYYASTMFLRLMPFGLIAGVIVAVVLMRGHASDIEGPSP